MNKYTIPTILTVTVLLAGMFTFMPVEKASTVHTTIIDSLDGLDVHVFVTSTVSPPITAADVELAAGPGLVDVGAGGGEFEVDVLVLDENGDGVLTLIEADFTFTVTSRSGGNAIAVVGASFAEVASGLYTFSASGGGDGTDLGILGVVDDYLVTVVVDDTNDDDTDETGTGVAVVRILITA